MMAAPLFLNKAVLALSAVAEHRENVAGEGIFGDEAINFHRNGVDLCPVAESIKITSFSRRQCSHVTCSTCMLHKKTELVTVCSAH